MRKLILLFPLLALLNGTAQEFSIPAEDYPFFDAVEWKGMGTMLLNRDPSGVKRKINITMVGEQTTSVWQQSFNPSGKDYFYIAGENARYVYFLDQLMPVDGKIFFHQVNSAGNIKSSSVLLSSAIKKLGSYDINEMSMTDIITTDKALVFLMRWNNKKDKKHVDFIITMTHHNMLLYAAIIGEIDEAMLKDPKYGHWGYSGFGEDEIYFTTPDYQDKKSGWTVRAFTSKAQLKESIFLEGGMNFTSVSLSASGATGGFYLKSKENSTGKVFYNKGSYYLVGIQSSQLETYTMKSGKWQKLQSTSFSPLNSKKGITDFTAMCLNEGIACTLEGKMYMLPTAGSIIVNSPNDRTPFNPSSFLIKDPKSSFAVSLSTSNLFLDPSQLNRQGELKFELIKK